MTTVMERTSSRRLTKWFGLGGRASSRACSCARRGGALSPQIRRHDEVQTEMTRLRIGLAIPIVSALLLSGCATTVPVSSVDQAAGPASRQISAMSGVRRATVHLEVTTDGLTKHRAIAVDIDAPDIGGSPEEVAELVNEVLPVAWSVPGTRPDSGVILRLHTEPQAAIGPIAQAAGWENVGFPTSKKLLEKLKYQARFTASDLDSRLGSWPLER